MNTTRNLSFYSISLFLSLAAAFGSANAAFAQKGIPTTGNRIDSLISLKDDYLNKKARYDSAFILKHPGHLLSKFLVSMINVPYPEVFPILPDGTKDSTFPLRWYKNHYLDHMDFGDDGLLRMPVNIVKQRLDFYFDKIIVPDADTCMMVAEKLLDQCKNTIEMEKYLIWYLTNRFESSNIMGLDRAFVRMAMSTYCQGKSWWVDSTTINKMCENAFRRAHTLIGETAPELELKDIKGNWVNTQKIRGPYVVMIFWDPTCGHCKEVMPKLAKIYEANKDKGWKVIALSSGDKKKEWEEYYNTHPETQAFTHLIRGEVQSQKYADALYSYYVVSSPTIYVLDADRKIVANRIDVDKMVEFLSHHSTEKNKIQTSNLGNKNDSYTQNPTDSEEILNNQLETILKITPYTRTAPIKPNVFGNYPDIKNAPAWDGREPGNYSIRFKIKTITPPKATPKITNIYAGDTVYLADHNTCGKPLRESAVSDKNGIAHFVGTKKLQRGMYLFVFPKKRDYFEFIIDDDLDFQIDIDTAWNTRDYYKNMKVTGSEENLAFLDYQKGKVDIIEKLMEIDQLIEQETKADSIERTKTVSTTQQNKESANLTPTIIEEIAPQETINETTEWKSSGTGFFINKTGYIATNYHVIANSKALEVEYFQNGKLHVYKAKTIVFDEINDIAIIKIEDENFFGTNNIPYVLNTKSQSVGKRVFTLGYPMTTIMGNEIKFTDGSISSKSGFSGDVTKYQISVPIQPGNSGGPLFDYKGNLIGITSGGLNRELLNTENVNYAIKSVFLGNLIDNLPERISIPNDIRIYDFPLEQKIQVLQEFIPLIRVR